MWVANKSGAADLVFMTKNWCSLTWAALPTHCWSFPCMATTSWPLAAWTSWRTALGQKYNCSAFAPNCTTESNKQQCLLDTDMPTQTTEKSSQYQLHKKEYQQKTQPCLPQTTLTRLLTILQPTKAFKSNQILFTRLQHDAGLLIISWHWGG